MLYIMYVSWFWIKQRPHFLAENLARYFKITVVHTIRAGMHNDLVRSEPPAFLRSVMILPFGRFAIIKAINNFLLRLQMRNLVKNSKYIWFTGPIEYGSLGRTITPSHVVIYDCMDDFLEFPPTKNNPEFYQKVFRYESGLLERADIVFVSSKHLQSVLEQRHPGMRTTYVMNNALSETFARGDASVPATGNGAYPAKDGFCDLLYVGTVSSWFDFNMVLECLDKFPTVRCILVGPNDFTLPNHPRIIALGPKKHQDLMYYMKRADALIMPFIVNDLIRSVNPVKLYEYIYAAKPVITCNYGEIDVFGEFVHRYNDKNEFFRLVERLLGHDLHQADEAKCREFVRANTWEERTHQMAELINGIKK